MKTLFLEFFAITLTWSLLACSIYALAIFLERRSDRLAIERDDYVPGEADSVFGLGKQRTLLSTVIAILGAVAVLLGFLWLWHLLAHSGIFRALLCVSSFASGAVVSLSVLKATKTGRNLSAVIRVDISMFAGTAVVIAWNLWHYWTVVDIVGVMLVLAPLLAVRLSFKAIFCFYAALVFFDFISVFMTKQMIGLANDAIADRLPLLIVVPSFLSGEGGKAFVLGLGDLVSAGLIIMSASRIAAQSIRRNVLIGTFAGFLVGVAASSAVCVFAKAAQPATVYILPGATIGLFLGAWSSKAMRFKIARRMVAARRVKDANATLV